jgi:hypothetical protein
VKFSIEGPAKKLVQAMAIPAVPNPIKPASARLSMVIAWCSFKQIKHRERSA